MWFCVWEHMFNVTPTAQGHLWMNKHYFKSDIFGTTSRQTVVIKSQAKNWLVVSDTTLTKYMQIYIFQLRKNTSLRNADLFSTHVFLNIILREYVSEYLSLISARAMHCIKMCFNPRNSPKAIYAGHFSPVNKNKKGCGYGGSQIGLNLKKLKLYHCASV